MRGQVNTDTARYTGRFRCRDGCLHERDNGSGLLKTMELGLMSITLLVYREVNSLGIS